MRTQTKRWWELTFRGFIAILAGIVLFTPFGRSFRPFVMTFGIWMFLDGVVALGTAIARHGGWTLIAEGISGVVLGVLTFVRPNITVASLYAVAIVWVLMLGMLRILAAVRYGHELSHTGVFKSVATGRIRDNAGYVGWLGVSGALSLLLGLLLVVSPPQTGALLLASWLGIYGLVMGALLVGISLSIRRASELPT